MDPKDKIDSLQFIAKLHRKQFDERRKYEWKILFTVLAFYALSAAASLKDELKRLSNYTRIDLFFILLALLTSSFLLFVHRANHLNKEISEKAEDAIQDILNEKNPTIALFSAESSQYSCENLSKWLKKSAWSWIWQTIVLISFAIVSGLLISR